MGPCDEKALQSCQPVLCKVDVSILQILAMFVPRQMVSKPTAPVSYVLIVEGQPVENLKLATLSHAGL